MVTSRENKVAQKHFFCLHCRILHPQESDARYSRVSNAQLVPWVCPALSIVPQGQSSAVLVPEKARSKRSVRQVLALPSSLHCALCLCPKGCPVPFGQRAQQRELTLCLCAEHNGWGVAQHPEIIRRACVRVSFLIPFSFLIPKGTDPVRAGQPH